MQFADPGERRRTVVIDGVSVAGARDAGLVHDVDFIVDEFVSDGRDKKVFVNVFLKF